MARPGPIDRRGLAMWALGTGFSLLLLVAGASAYLTVGRAFPSLLVDPYADYSLVRLPTWADAPAGLRHPDAWVRGGETEIAPAPARHPFAQFSSGWKGEPEVPLVFRTSEGKVVHVTAPVRKVGFGEVWVFFLLYALTGVFVVVSALVVVRISERPTARFAYVAWSTSIATFLITFYDYHTHGWLKPLFTAATVGMLSGPLLLALSFPDYPKRRVRLWRGLAVLVGAAAVLVGAGAFLVSCAGRDPLWVRRGVTALLAPTMALLGAVVLVRYFKGDKRERQELRSALWGLTAVPLTGGVVLGLSLWTGSDLLHLFLPLLVASFPLSIGYALVRRNIFAATAVLQRRALVAPVAVSGVMAATLAWVYLELALRRSDASEVVPPVVAFGVFAVVVTSAWRFGTRLLFPAARHFRPTVEKLGDALGREREEARLRRTLADVTRQWLPTRSIQLLQLAEVPSQPGVPPEAVERLQRGERVWTLGSGWERGLLVPLRSLGEVRGVLHVAPKEDYALFTDEDLALLETVASLGAIALHNASVLAELEGLRKWQVDAARDEKRLTLGMIGAEISHELAYPLNFFRYLLRQSEQGVSHEDREIGREEVERLERMLQSLRRLTVPAPRVEPVNVLQTARRVLHLCRDLVEQKALEVVLEIPEDATVLADPDPLVQLFSNLLRNAAQAVEAHGRVGVRFSRDGMASALEVWDDGPGIPEDLRDTLFNPWVTTRAGGTGLGLAVTQRIVRSFGWTLNVESEPGHTTFRIHVPPSSETGAAVPRSEVA